MILITGATGYIGQNLLLDLSHKENFVQCISRDKDAVALLQNISPLCLAINADLLVPENLLAVCEGVSTVFHCAGYAHAFGSSDATMHWRVNFEGTRNLVEAAASAGVRTFVFLSSVKAMADPGTACADEDWPGEPETPYGQSKRAAEKAVLAVGRKSNMHVVVLRLAMVYGSGSRGNLERMAALVRRGLFPPLPETGNQRSLVHVQDVISVMQLVANDSRATGRTYIVAEPRAYSGRQIYEVLCSQTGRHPGKFAVPACILKALALGGDFLEKITRRPCWYSSEVYDRLLGSAWYSPRKIESELGWRAQRCFAERPEVQ